MTHMMVSNSCAARAGVIAKWLWLAVVLLAVSLVLKRYSGAIADQLIAIGPRAITFSFTALLAGKALLAVGSWYSVRSQGVSITYGSVFAMVSLSQLGKYAPGPVLHLFGRGWLYSKRGIKLESITRALFLENVWQWLAAALVGASLLLFMSGSRTAISQLAPARLALVFGCGLASWWAVAYWLRNRFAPTDVASLYPGWRLLAILTVAWICFGLSFYALWPDNPGFHELVLATGAFSAASLAGFLAPFAPAGLGVREAALVATTAQTLTAEQAIAVAAISRLVWILGEMVLAGSSYLFVRSGRD